MKPLILIALPALIALGAFALNPGGLAQEPVIDLDVVFSSYLGGSANDVATGVALDSDGAIYITGYTGSANFPTISPAGAGPADTTLDGTSDLFVTKFSSSGSLIYSTYIGGSGDDQGLAITVSEDGFAYVTGLTASPDFPVVVPRNQGPASYQTDQPGTDAFVLRLNQGATALNFSTYLGGDDYDEGSAIALDAAGNLYVTGNTNSTDFPTTAGVYGNTRTGNRDAFVTKFNSTGVRLISTYLGGDRNDYGTGVAANNSQEVFLAGYTESDNFPTTAGVIQPSRGGQGTSATSDAFVTKLNSTFSALIYSTYLGGSRSDQSTGLAIDSSGNAYVTGSTESTDFPTQTALQETSGGGIDGFVSVINSTGTAFRYSTYLGGSAFDRGTAIAVDSVMNVYVTGLTTSTNFPTASPFQGDNQGLGDAFIARLSSGISEGVFNAASITRVYSSYLGGINLDEGLALAVDGTRTAFVAGRTGSDDFPVAATTGSPYQSNLNGTTDSYIYKIQTDPPPQAPPSSPPPACASDEDCAEGEICENENCVPGTPPAGTTDRSSGGASTGAAGVGSGGTTETGATGGTGAGVTGAGGGVTPPLPPPPTELPPFPSGAKEGETETSQTNLDETGFDGAADGTATSGDSGEEGGCSCSVCQR